MMGLSRSLTVLGCSVLLVSGCFQDPPHPGIDDTDDASGDPTGDGDGDGDPTGDGDGDPTGDGDGDPTGDGDGDPGEPCGSGFECVPDPGPDWSGPFALADASDGCGGDFPDQAATMFADLSADPAQCECTCGQPEVNCSTSMSVIGYAAINCVNGQGSNGISENQCYNTFSASHAVTLGSASSSCAAGSVDETLPPPSFVDELVSCAGFAPNPGICDDDGAACVPTPGASFAGGLCYVADGDQTCPADFPSKSVLYTSVDDSRSCDDSCSCDASGAVCTVSITGFASPNCVSPQGAMSADSGGQVCAAVNSAIVESIRPGSVVVDDAGSCSPGEATASGDIAPAGAKTVCCTD